MKHSNISIFIPHVGCPHKCSFCDQRTISGAQKLPSGEDVRVICSQALTEISSPENTEIAFFGGSFTAIPRDYMLELLEAAHEFIGEGKFRGIRCSTRPDCIDPEILFTLKDYGVTAIELGAQSMCGEVLEANERGHTAQDVVNASMLIKEYGFELGLQMMTGLYRSSAENDYDTAVRLIKLRPATVRIYPVVILKNTRLAELYQSGEYILRPFDDMAYLCARIMYRFHEAEIRVIKCGLHASEFVEQDMVAGYYHPAFRELCDMYIYRDEIVWKMFLENLNEGDFIIEVNDKCISRATGQKRANIEFFKKQGINIRIVGDPDIPVYECAIRK